MVSATANNKKESANGFVHFLKRTFGVTASDIVFNVILYVFVSRFWS